MSYQDLKHNSQPISAHTGLSKVECDAIAVEDEFAKEVDTYRPYFTLEGLARQRYMSRENEWITYLDRQTTVYTFVS